MDRQEGQPGAAAAAPQEEIASVSQPSYSIDNFGTIIFVVVVVEILIMIGLNFYQTSRIHSLTTQKNAVQTKLASANYATLNNEVNQVLSGNQQLQVILASKVKWSVFYNELNNVTPKTIQFTTFSIAQNGTFKADGKTDSLQTLAKALVAWQHGVGDVKTPFASVILSSDSLANGSGNRQVTFSISGQINTGSLR